jgi:hypothetical protein
MTTSPIGCEQQTRTLPSASFLESELDAPAGVAGGQVGRDYNKNSLLGSSSKKASSIFRKRGYTPSG